MTWDVEFRAQTIRMVENQMEDDVKAGHFIRVYVGNVM